MCATEEQQQQLVSIRKPVLVDGKQTLTYAQAFEAYRYYELWAKPPGPEGSRISDRLQNQLVGGYAQVKYATWRDHAEPAAAEGGLQPLQSEKVAAAVRDLTHALYQKKQEVN